jgi:hypothetical protein
MKRNVLAYKEDNCIGHILRKMCLLEHFIEKCTRKDGSDGEDEEEGVSSYRKTLRIR